MFKKTCIGLLIILAAGFLGAMFLAKSAPDLLRQALTRALSCDVRIEKVIYHFPGRFELEGFELRQKGGRFDKEILFTTKHIGLDISPFSLFKQELIADKISVQKAEVYIRRWQKVFYQPFTSALRPPNTEKTVTSSTRESSPKKQIPLTIRQLVIKESEIKLIDYDIAAEGFVTGMAITEAKISDVRFPAVAKKTQYSLKGVILQDKPERPAEIILSGWTDFATKDTQALFGAEDLHLPYFKPYYRQITWASITEGYLGMKVSVDIREGNLTSNADFTVKDLTLQSYEDNNELFGLKADDVLSFLKDSSGILRFQTVVEWNLNDKNVKLKDVVRRSIEKSLKKSIVGNVGNIIASTLTKLGDGSLSQKKEKVEDQIKQIKNLFKY